MNDHHQHADQDGEFELVSATLGGQPIINQVMDRLGLPALLAAALPAEDARIKLAPAVAIRVVVANLVLGREPLYGLSESAARYDPRLLGLGEGDLQVLNDDRVGRALEALFDADRASLLTAAVLRAVAELNVKTTQLHNDSTSISVHDLYPEAIGTVRAGKPTPVITVGHSKDHRPDLKQLVWILTVSADGAVPLTYRLADGNTNDDPTHVPTWDGLVALLGQSGVLYVADSKLCSRAAMGHIDGHGGRFVTVLPRSRAEEGMFREHLQTHTPTWVEAARRPGTRIGKPEQVYSVTPAPTPSAEAYLRIHTGHARANKEAHTLIRQVLTQSGDIDPDAAAGTLTIRLDPMPTRRATAAIAQLTATQTVYPDTSLVLRFEIKTR